jgi:hypothetical protein
VLGQRWRSKFSDAVFTDRLVVLPLPTWGTRKESGFMLVSWLKRYSIVVRTGF